jgi:hypothetical protein
MTDYYVAESGDDTADGLTRDRPWQTRAKVNASTFRPGDRILFNRGDSWTGGQFTVADSGTAKLPIRIDVYGTGPRPVFENAGVFPSYTRVWHIRGDYITLANLHVQDCHDAGIYVDRADHVTVQNCEINNMGAGVRTWEADYTTITRCYIHDASTIRDVVGNCAGPKGISIRGSHITITNNTIRNTLDSTVCYGDASGNIAEFWAHGYTTGFTIDDVIIAQNWCENAGSIELIGAVGTGAVVQNVEIYSNVFHNNKQFVWIHKGHATLDVAIDNIRVYANTIVENALPAQHAQIVGFPTLGGGPTATEFLFYNNLIYGRQGPDPDPDNLRRVFFTPGSMTHTHNLYDYDWTLFSNVPAFTAHATEIIDAAGFAEIGGDNFRLRTGSLARDAGTADGLTTDHAGRPRPQGQAPDIGAYEATPVAVEGPRLPQRIRDRYRAALFVMGR